MTAPFRARGDSRLNAARRARELDALADVAEIDVLVVGGGITGAGLALDAAARGLSTVLVERADLAAGTSAASSKLVHGGIRYLATGQVGIAHESAAERHLLMTRIAPHLTRPLAQVLPLHGAAARRRGAYIGTGYVLGDGLRRVVRTPGALLPGPRAIGAGEVRRLAPAVSAEGLVGGVRAWDGQLIDDARLVVAVARTAAAHGAGILTRVRAVSVTGYGAVLRDELTGAELAVRARAVVNAAGVWAGQVDPAVRLRPSRGTHLVLDSARFGFSDVSLLTPVPGSRSRMLFTLPAVHGRTYLGLTDEPVAGAVPDAAQSSPDEIAFLLDAASAALEVPLGPADVLGTFVGMRPLLVPAHGSSPDHAQHADADADADADASTADLSRRHAVLTSPDGVFSVVGGKLTTYRRMAQDGIDAVVAQRLLTPRPSPTAGLPLVGAWPRARLAAVPASARLVRRYGAEAPAVAALGAEVAGPHGVTAGEFAFGVRVEGALTVDDLLARRTRLGLVAADRDAALPAAQAALE